jgi:regulator of protease activity HflC (stomatin/prohibitin superfamily)
MLNKICTSPIYPNSVCLGPQVDTATLEKQVQERRLQMAEAQRAKRLEEEQTLRWVAAAEWLHQQADAVRRHNAESTASLQLKQAQEKKVRDEALEALLRNRIEEAYFRQFGTSHR